MNVISINPVNINAAQSALRKNLFNQHIGEAKGVAKGTATPSDINRRFDTFTMTGTEKDGEEANCKKLDEKTSELIRGLSKATEKEKSKLAYTSYIGMLKCLGEVKDNLEFHVDCFKEIKDKKEYYGALIDANGRIGADGGRYDFEDKTEGSIVDMRELQEKYAKAVERIDSYFGRPKKKGYMPGEIKQEGVGYISAERSNRWFEHEFKTYAAVFSAVTGSSGNALELKEKEYFLDGNRLNEDNFLEETSKMLDSIDQRTKGLGEMFSEYSYNNRHMREIMEDPSKALEEAKELTDSEIGKLIREYSEYIMNGLLEPEKPTDTL